jgi:hypothetical protein
MTMNGDCSNKLESLSRQHFHKKGSLWYINPIHFLSIDSEGMCRNVTGVYAHRNWKLR